MPVSATELRQNLYKLLDQVAATGVPVEIVRKGAKLRIVADASPASTRTLSKFARLPTNPNLISGDPEDLVHIDWSSEWRP